MALLARLVDVQTAWTLVTHCLDTVDLVALYVTALDHPQTLDTVVHAFRYDIDGINADSTAAHGCVRAVQTLLKAQPSTTGKPMHQHMQQFTPSQVTVRIRQMQWLNTFRPFVYPADVMYTAVGHGDMAVVEWLHSCCEYETHVAMVAAATKGHLSMVEWLDSHQATCIFRRGGRRHTKTAILVPLGRLGAVVWVEFTSTFSNDVRRSAGVEHFATSTSHAQGRFNNHQAHVPRTLFVGPLCAARTGNLSLLHKLHHDTDTAWQWTSDVMDAAAANGHLHVVQWLLANRADTCTSAAINKAASNGHLDVVEWLHQHQVRGIQQEIVEAVVESGHLEVAKWLFDHYARLKPSPTLFPGEPHKVENAALRRRFEIFRWLHTQDPMRYPVDPGHYRFAINNHCSIEQIEWARERLASDWPNHAEVCNWIDYGGFFRHGELELVQHPNQLREVPVSMIVRVAITARQLGSL